MFFLVLQFAIAVLLNYYRGDTAQDIIWDNKAREEHKILPGKNNNNLGLFPNKPKLDNYFLELDCKNTSNHWVL